MRTQIASMWLLVLDTSSDLRERLFHTFKGKCAFYHYVKRNYGHTLGPAACNCHARQHHGQWGSAWCACLSPEHLLISTSLWRRAIRRTQAALILVTFESTIVRFTGRSSADDGRRVAMQMCRGKNTAKREKCLPKWQFLQQDSPANIYKESSWNERSDFLPGHYASKNLRSCEHLNAAYNCWPAFFTQTADWDSNARAHAHSQLWLLGLAASSDVRERLFHTFKGKCACYHYVKRNYGHTLGPAAFICYARQRHGQWGSAWCACLSPEHLLVSTSLWRQAIRRTQAALILVTFESTIVRFTGRSSADDGRRVATQMRRGKTHGQKGKVFAEVAVSSAGQPCNIQASTKKAPGMSAVTSYLGAMRANILGHASI